MNKKIIVALIALTTIIPTTANAAFKTVDTVTKPTLAILDTALDTTLPGLSNNVVYEVCILELPSCANGKTFMEGKGAAYLPPSIMNNRLGFDHGMQMTYTAIQNNPNINIVFIRIIGNNPSGGRQNSGEATVYNALQWVIDNQARFNIQAVSMAQAHHNLGAVGTNYCPKTPTTQSKVQTLSGMNVPVFFPTGNDRDYSRINWPACLPESISVGATMPTGDIAIYSNYDPLLTDFFAQGTLQVTGPNGIKMNLAGTSASVQVAASNWIAVKTKKSSATYNDIYNLFVKTSISTKNSKITGGKLINLIGALNG